jgi:predicted ATP-grasp superfamily ATP-dependent carboligase
MKFWRAVLKNNRHITETDEGITWDAIKDEVKELYMVGENNQMIHLPKNMESFIQGKSASADMSNGKCEIESRFIGGKIGNITVRIRVGEKTNNINIELSKNK